MKENPESLMYRRIYRMNIRCYFHAGTNYHLMDYEKTAENLPPALFHVTSGADAERIASQGLKNEKTNIIFMTNAEKYLRYFQSVRQDSVVLSVDVHRAAAEGIEFYRNQQDNWMWITEWVPAEYLSVTTLESGKELLI